MTNKEQLKENIQDLSGRELDILVAKYVFGLKTQVERSTYGKIRVVAEFPKTKRKYTSYYSKSKSKLEKSNPNIRPLPRYSKDLRDCFVLLKKYESAFTLSFLKKNLYSIQDSTVSFEGRSVPTLLCKFILYKTLLDKV